VRSFLVRDSAGYGPESFWPICLYPRAEGIRTKNRVDRHRGIGYGDSGRNKYKEIKPIYREEDG